MAAPSVGRIVHYVDENNDCIAALITEANDTSESQMVELTIFPPGASPEVKENVEIDSSHSPNTWHWPELVL